jgi:hypothetical protein
MSFGDLPLTSLSDAFDELVRSCIIDAVEKLPGYANVLLSGLAYPSAEHRGCASGGCGSQRFWL